MGKLDLAGIVMVDDEDNSESSSTIEQYAHYIWG